MFDLTDLFTSTTEFNFAPIQADSLSLSERASMDGAEVPERLTLHDYW